MNSVAYQAMKYLTLLLALAVTATAETTREAEAAERLLVAHRIHCAFNASDPACKDENERKAREVRAEWENRAKVKSAPMAAYPVGAYDYDEAASMERVREIGRRALEEMKPKRREQPPQQVCYTETLPGPAGPTYRTVCQ